MALTSCLYRGSSTHMRFQPNKHRFRFPLFMFYLSSQELPQLETNSHLFGYNRRRCFSFNDLDYLKQADSPTLLGRIRQLAPTEIAETITHFHFLGHVRTFGYLYNPVCFFFAFNANNEHVLTLYEVTNTYHERKVYLQTQSLGEELAIAKHFYVSPFVDPCSTFRAQIPLPKETLRITIDSYDSGNKQRIVHANLVGQAQPLNTPRLLFYMLRFPLMPIQVLLGIHWQALKLYRKKIPFYRKQDSDRQLQGLK